ncbi:MAG: hypothetical protein NT067_00920 [Candidatus Diapherotrites archaeon]|nr:hypothetical protein [Candidatus Diapherotrites archaeon]
MTEEKPFRDFSLLVLNHPGPGEDVNRVIEERLERGKAEILRRTRGGRKGKPGDLILLEAAKRKSFEEWADQVRPAMEAFAGKEECEARLRQFWEGSERRKVNFYAELAEFAAANGRRVASLEPAITRGIFQQWHLDTLEEAKYISEFLHRSSAYPLSALEPPPPLPPTEVKALFSEGRTKTFMSRIRQLKPKMAIMAEAHGVVAEHFMRPKRVIYFPEPNREWKQQALATMLGEIGWLGLNRKLRRSEINRALMERGKLPKTAAKRQQRQSEPRRV